MKALALLAAATLVAAPSAAQAPAGTVANPAVGPATGPGTTHYDGPPPAKYARDTVAVVLFTDLNGVKRECGEAPPPLTRMGCAGVRPDGVKIAILLHPSFMPSNPYAVYINHELAHLNGWPGTHPL